MVAPVAAKDPDAAPARRLGSVDEVIRELFLRLLRGGGESRLRERLEERPPQLVDPRARDGGDRDHAHYPFVLPVERSRFRQEVRLVEDDHLGTIRETGPVCAKLAVDRGEASVDGMLCAQGELLASIVDRVP